MKPKRILVTALVLGVLGAQSLWAGWALLSDGLMERDARRLETARTNHASDIERAFGVYSNQVERANTTLARQYEQVTRQYESRGAKDVVDSLKKELDGLTAGALKMPFPEEKDEKQKEKQGADRFARLIEILGPQVVNARGHWAPTARIADYDHIVLYFTASWCAPCRRFTPDLITFYNQNRNVGKWEIIVVSGDRTEMAFQNYLLSSNMPWAAVPYERGEHVQSVFSGGYPRLLVFDAQSRPVFRSRLGQQSHAETLDALRGVLQR